MIGIHTPWGISDNEGTELAPGITKLSTPSHGGIRLSVDRHEKVHPAWRTGDGWYEEDLEANIVVFTFPGEFPSEALEYATRQLKNYFPKAYMTVTGETLAAGDSVVLRREEFERATEDQFVVAAAFGSDPVAAPRSPIPEGMVGVVARQRGTRKEGWFLVPKDEYRTRREPGTGFVIDTARHARWESLDVGRDAEEAKEIHRKRSRSI